MALSRSSVQLCQVVSAELESLTYLQVCKALKLCNHHVEELETNGTALHQGKKTILTKVHHACQARLLHALCQA